LLNFLKWGLLATIKLVDTLTHRSDEVDLQSDVM
jgi:hypothetical protein